MAGHGAPHAQPVALPPDARGRSRWLAFVGTHDVAWGAWRIAVGADGAAEIDPVTTWPTGVRVVGAVVEGGLAYVLLESLGVLDQPAGLRAVWIDAAAGPSPFEASPMALSDVRTIAELASRVKHAPPAESDPGGPLAALRAASASTATLASSLAREGADVRIVWQSLFTQPIGRLDADAAGPSFLAASVVGAMRDSLATQACGADACEGWTDGVRTIVRFVRQDGRWAVRSILEDAQAPRATPGASPPRAVLQSADTAETEALLRARARKVDRVLGQAPLTADGGTIGVAMTDMSPGGPVVAVREGHAARVFAIDAAAVRAEGPGIAWEAAFADVDGDGRTDVVLRWSSAGPGGAALAWTQAFLAPPPTVQASLLSPDLASALALMDAPDLEGAVRAAAALPPQGVARDEACRLLADATTPAGLRRQASPEARILQFEEPGLPTWRPKVIPASKVAPDDLRSLSAHCADLACSAARPYCAWTGGADSEHLWFGWRDGRPEIVGAAAYEGE
jgi:hypothetical protein